MDLHNLISAEIAAKKALMDGMNIKLDYHDIYKLAKDRVMALADILLIDPPKQLSSSA